MFVSHPVSNCHVGSPSTPVSPPSECPMHQATPAPAPSQGPVHQDRAYEFVECPMKAGAQGLGPMGDIDPANMVNI